MSDIVSRNKDNQICLDSLSLQIYFDDMFIKCKTEREIDFLLENICGYAEKCADETREEL